ncbi:flagellar biosynthetic protein FliR [Crenobacter cavernae]|uniref:Flagellar biosynthetic protein FliR n=1 Tax=Crenobacter cavernae TaxID=2290923 RepID=A0A345Y789_9NEIS|nr:flagellar biosynthetic protein FliR [Crenobacter cavernae]AXK39791.1 flagellar biosynthetic protein FliR [Crenobacter cavernae]
MLAITDAQINALVAVFIWPFARIAGLIMADPLLATRGVPRRFKAGFAFFLTVLIAPILPPLPDVPLVSAEGVAILVQQLLIGVGIGFATRIVMGAVELAGFTIGTQMGLGFALFFDPMSSAQVPGVARLLSIFVFLLFLMMGGLQVLVGTLVDSFTVLPIGQSVPVEGWRTLAEWGGHLFLWGVWLSLPVVAALLVTNLAIGVMTRAAPQFNVFSFGFPLTLLIGFIALYFALPLLVPAVETMYREAFGFVNVWLRTPKP